jgi:hypothetical protein
MTVAQLAVERMSSLEMGRLTAHQYCEVPGSWRLRSLCGRLCEPGLYGEDQSCPEGGLALLR